MAGSPSVRVLADVPFSLTVRRAVRPGRVDELLQQLSLVTDVSLSQLEECLAGAGEPRIGYADVDQQLDLLFGDVVTQAADSLEEWARDSGSRERAGRLILMVLDDKAVLPEE